MTNWGGGTLLVLPVPKTAIYDRIFKYIIQQMGKKTHLLAKFSDHAFIHSKSL